MNSMSSSTGSSKRNTTLLLSDRDAAKAADELRASLGSWTSPKLGTVPLSSSRPKSERYHPDRMMDDPNAWENDDDDDDLFMDAALLHTTTTPDMNETTTETKRSKISHRSNTPVMSNHSSQMDDKQEEEEDVEMPYNIQSPWVVNPTSPYDTAVKRTVTQPATSLTPYKTTPTPTVPSRTTVNRTARNDDDDDSSRIVIRNPLGASRFQPYYNATERWWRFHRQQQQQSSPAAAVALVHPEEEETKMELDFLMTLHRFGWSTTTTSRHYTTTSGDNNSHWPPVEGNFWWLLHQLRQQLGTATLLWDNDTASLQQHERAIQSHLQSIAVQTNLTPAAILQSFYHSPPAASCCPPNRSVTDTFLAPLSIQRRKLILEWLHACFQNTLPSDIGRPRRTNKLLDSNSLLLHSKMYECGLYRTDKDDELLTSCLALLCAGRFHTEALDLLRQSRVSWRAALYGGGVPHGYTTTTTPDHAAVPKLRTVGNPDRALWRRLMWKHSQELANRDDDNNKNNNSTSKRSRDAEVAIAALLSSHLELALVCAPLRTWECGLYSIMRCMMDRMEDDLLHRHNNYRRSVQGEAGPMFPGTQHKISEREHLQETIDIAMIKNESDAIRILHGSPFKEMRGNDVVRRATASFIIGKSAIAAFLQTCVENVTQLTDDELRFVTHVAFYLDALSCSKTTPVVLPNVKEWKNELVFHYLSLLAGQDDLWYMIVLYSSFLPVDTILDILPKLLETMESMEERKVIVQQLREFLPQQNLDLEVLRRVVDLVLSESDDNNGNNEIDDGQGRSLIGPTALDIRKMESVLWLCIQNDHADEAMIAANRLLRKFFLSGHNKISSAILFIDEVLNDLSSSFCANAVDSMGDQDQSIAYARLEHLAYRSFLEATKSEQNWKDVVRETPHTLLENGLDDDEGIDKNVLNATELGIAMNAERRKIINIKRAATQNVVTVAERACSELRRVLEHPGGWLLTEDEELPPNDVEAILRRKELDQLHCQFLPHVVFTYHDVCVGTALWMSKSLDDTAEALNVVAKDAVRMIDDTITDDIIPSPVSPRYWTQKALELAEMTMKETYNVNSAFRSADYEKLLTRLAETTVVDCLYRYAE